MPLKGKVILERTDKNNEGDLINRKKHFRHLSNILAVGSVASLNFMTFSDI